MLDVDYSISEQRNKLYSHKKSFSPKDAAAIMLSIDPMYLEYNQFPDVELLANILIELAENGEFKDFEYEAEFNVQWIDKISAKELEQWALSNEYHWVNYSSNNNAVHNIAELHQQLEQERSKAEELQARITELENQKQVETQIIAEPKQVRIQKHHRALFALLVKKNYKGFDTRNSLFNAINADLKLNGITSDETKFDTYNKLIDDKLFKQLEIFPNKKR